MVRIKTEDEKTIKRNALALEHKGFACSLARKKQAWGRKVGLLEEDLLQDAFEGMLKGAERYDPGRGARFITFAAYHIRATIQKDIRRNRRLGGLNASEGATVPVLSFDQQPSEDGLPYAEKIAAPDNTENGLSVEKVSEILREMILEKLDERERYIIISRFYMKEPISREEIGKSLQISRERVRQLELRGLDKIKKEFRRQGILRAALTLVNDEYDFD